MLIFQREGYQSATGFLWALFIQNHRSSWCQRLSRLPSPASLAKRSLLPRPPPVWHALPRGLGGARRRAWCGCGWDSFQVMPETGPQTTGMFEDVKKAAKVAKPERSIWSFLDGSCFLAANICRMKLNQTGMIECLKWAWVCWFLIVFVAGLLTKNACRPRSLDFNSSQFVNRFVLRSRWHVHSARLEQGSKAGPSVHYTLHGRGASTGTPGRRGCQWQTSCATSSMHLQVGKRGRPGWVECWQGFGLCLFLGWDNEILVVWKVRVCLKNLES